MKLDKAVKYFSPKSLHISDSAPATSKDALTSTDIMAGLGMTQSKAGFGLSLFLAKTEISEEDKKRAIQLLTQFALKKAPKLVGKASGRKIAACMAILSKCAYEDYSRSAANKIICSRCNGEKLIEKEEEIKLTTGVKVRKARVLCPTCNGKGLVSARCRCNGTGLTADKEKTKLFKIPVTKECKRCAGRGYKRVPASVAYNAIKHLLPELTQQTWSRNWKPFYENLVQQCYKEETFADFTFDYVTR